MRVLPVLVSAPQRRMEFCFCDSIRKQERLWQLFGWQPNEKVLLSVTLAHIYIYKQFRQLTRINVAWSQLSDTAHHTTGSDFNEWIERDTVKRLTMGVPIDI